MEVLATKFDAAVVGRNNRAVTLHGMVHALRDLGGGHLVACHHAEQEVTA